MPQVRSGARAGFRAFSASTSGFVLTSDLSQAARNKLVQQPNNMFELMAHAAHMKAHFTSLVPEESRHEYVQEHKMGFCTQFKHCETNPFYPDVVQADGNAGWYSTDQSGWIGQSDDPAGAIGSGGEWVNGELPASGSGTYEYNWGSFVYPTARGNGGLGGGGHPMGCWAMHDKIDGKVC